MEILHSNLIEPKKRNNIADVFGIYTRTSSTNICGALLGRILGALPSHFGLKGLQPYMIWTELLKLSSRLPTPHKASQSRASRNGLES